MTWLEQTLDRHVPVMWAEPSWLDRESGGRVMEEDQEAAPDTVSVADQSPNKPPFGGASPVTVLLVLIAALGVLALVVGAIMEVWMNGDLPAKIAQTGVIVAFASGIGALAWETLT